MPECQRALATSAYLSLDEVVTLCPDMLQEPQDIHCAFVFDLLQHAVYYNVGACPAHARAGRNKDTRLVPAALWTGAVTISAANERRNSPDVQTGYSTWIASKDLLRTLPTSQVWMGSQGCLHTMGL